MPVTLKERFRHIYKSSSCFSIDPTGLKCNFRNLVIDKQYFVPRKLLKIILKAVRHFSSHSIYRQYLGL